MRNQKGITLIALVITIIVLLILAGVSIAMLTGQNGILTQANSAKSDTAKAEAVERINLSLNAVKAKIYEKKVSLSTYNPTVAVENKVTLDTNNKIDNDIKELLDVDGIDYGTSPVNGSYTWDVVSGSLVIKYYNTTTKVGIGANNAEAPITGSISLTSPYTISPAQ